MSDLRPDHYKKGEDTFAWAEKKFGIEYCLAICAFNIHKYNDRNKGDDYKDFGKIADYAMWARDMMERDQTEVTEAKSTKREYAPDSHFDNKDLIDSDELTYNEHKRAKERGKEDSSVEAWIKGSGLIMRERDDEGRIVINVRGTRDAFRFRTYDEFFTWLNDKWADVVRKNA